MKTFALALVVSLSLLLACGKSTPPNEAAIRNAVTEVLNQQVAGWNRGDLEQFMAGYAHSEELRFVGGSDVAYGWETLLERYKKRYPDRAIMGRLSFADLDISVLSPDAALVFGKWQLERENDTPWGYFTLLFRKTDEGWRIVHDHSSSAN